MPLLFQAKTFASEIEAFCKDPAKLGLPLHPYLGREFVRAIYRSGISLSEFQKAVRAVHAMGAFKDMSRNLAFDYALDSLVAIERPMFSWRTLKAQQTFAKLDFILSELGSVFVSAAYILGRIAYDELLKDEVQWKRMEPMLDFLIERITTLEDIGRVTDVAKYCGQMLLLCRLEEREKEIKLEASGQDDELENERMWNFAYYESETEEGDSDFEDEWDPSHLLTSDSNIPSESGKEKASHLEGFATTPTEPLSAPEAATATVPIPQTKIESQKRKRSEDKPEEVLKLQRL